MKKVLLLFSGGLDSTVAAYFLKAAGLEIHAVYFDVGYLPQLKTAQSLAETFSKNFWVFDIRNIFTQLKVPGQKYIPGYRIVMYSITLSLAEKLEIEEIYTGEIGQSLQGEDYNKFGIFLKDDSQFRDKMEEGTFREKLAGLYTHFCPTIEKPEEEYFRFIEIFGGMTKANVIKLGTQLGVPFEQTLSCQNIQDPSIQLLLENSVHCGKSDCYFCNDRKEAFEEAEIEDPTIYLEERFAIAGQEKGGDKDGGADH